LLPPLRSRAEDIPLLVQHFINEFNVKHRLQIIGVNDEAMTMLRAYPWPGNVRELRNVTERSVVLAKGDWIEESALPPYVRNPALSEINMNLASTALRMIELASIVEEDSRKFFVTHDAIYERQITEIRQEFLGNLEILEKMGRSKREIAENEKLRSALTNYWDVFNRIKRQGRVSNLDYLPADLSIAIDHLQ